MPLLKLKLILNCSPVLNKSRVIPALLSTLQSRSSYYENVTCTKATLTELEIIT